MCEVQIKDESSSNDTAPNTTQENHINDVDNDDDDKVKSPKKSKQTHDDSFSTFTNPLSTSFDVLNLLRNSSASTTNLFNSKYTDEIQLIIEMQAKEHALRMDILRAQLDTAKLNRDIAEINKIILLRGLQNEQD